MAGVRGDSQDNCTWRRLTFTRRGESCTGSSPGASLYARRSREAVQPGAVLPTTRQRRRALPWRLASAAAWPTFFSASRRGVLPPSCLLEPHRGEPSSKNAAAAAATLPVSDPYEKVPASERVCFLPELAAGQHGTFRACQLSGSPFIWRRPHQRHFHLLRSAPGNHHPSNVSLPRRDFAAF